MEDSERRKKHSRRRRRRRAARNVHRPFARPVWGRGAERLRGHPSRQSPSPDRSCWFRRLASAARVQRKRTALPPSIPIVIVTGSTRELDRRWRAAAQAGRSDDSSRRWAMLPANLGRGRPVALRRRRRVDDAMATGRIRQPVSKPDARPACARLPTRPQRPHRLSRAAHGAGLRCGADAASALPPLCRRALTPVAQGEIVGPVRKQGGRHDGEAVGSGSEKGGAAAASSRPSGCRIAFHPSAPPMRSGARQEWLDIARTPC